MCNTRKTSHPSRSCSHSNPPFGQATTLEVTLECSMPASVKVDQDLKLERSFQAVRSQALKSKELMTGFFVHHLDTHEIPKGSSFSILFFMRMKKKWKSERGVIFRRLARSRKSSVDREFCSVSECVCELVHGHHFYSGFRTWSSSSTSLGPRPRNFHISCLHMSITCIFEEVTFTLWWHKRFSTQLKIKVSTAILDSREKCRYFEKLQKSFLVPCAIREREIEASKGVPVGI